MYKVFKSQIDRNVFAYVDDILVKSSEISRHATSYLEETFKTLQVLWNETKSG